MGTSVLFITHDIGVVAQMADEVCVMYKGRIVERGGVRPVLKKPLPPPPPPPPPSHARSSPPVRFPAWLLWGKRLPTIDTVLAGRDISQPLPLRPTQDGALVALSEEEILQMSV